VAFHGREEGKETGAEVPRLAPDHQDVCEHQAWKGSGTSSAPADPDPPQFLHKHRTVGAPSAPSRENISLPRRLARNPGINCSRRAHALRGGVR